MAQLQRQVVQQEQQLDELRQPQQQWQHEQLAKLRPEEVRRLRQQEQLRQKLIQQHNGTPKLSISTKDQEVLHYEQEQKQGLRIQEDLLRMQQNHVQHLQCRLQQLQLQLQQTKQVQQQEGATKQKEKYALRKKQQEQEHRVNEQQLQLEYELQQVRVTEERIMIQKQEHENMSWQQRQQQTIVMKQQQSQVLSTDVQTQKPKLQQPLHHRQQQGARPSNLIQRFHINLRQETAAAQALMQLKHPREVIVRPASPSFQ